MKIDSISPGIGRLAVACRTCIQHARNIGISPKKNQTMKMHIRKLFRLPVRVASLGSELRHLRPGTQRRMFLNNLALSIVTWGEPGLRKLGSGREFRKHSCSRLYKYRRLSLCRAMVRARWECGPSAFRETWWGFSSAARSQEQTLPTGTTLLPLGWGGCVGKQHLTGPTNSRGANLSLVVRLGFRIRTWDVRVRFGWQSQ